MTGIALIGAGRMAKVHVASIIAAGAKIATIYDPVAEASKLLAAQTDAKVCYSAAEAMNDPSAEAIIIATSSDTHIELLYEAVKAKKPVLCEKPLSANYQEGIKFIRTIGDDAAKKICVGFNRRFDRGHASVRNGVHAGHIGRLEQLTITSRDPYPPPLEYIPRSGGLFRDMMIHDFDMARSIIQQPIISVTAHGSSIVDPEIGKLGDIDTASVTMIAEDGALITILNSRHCAFGFDQRIEAFGAKGMLVSDNPRQSGYTTYTSEYPGTSAPILEFFMERYGPSYTAEIQTFIACSREGKDMPINAIDGMMAAYLAEASTASLKHKKTITLTGLDQEFTHV
ncbi:Gfo/Idh/MocA family protein [Commensalibacter communis]|uniref:Gfo/Idh/MocA family protein n=1 Tax=Commensalibacter communis TaxID=2972786 RepID=UPI0022FF78FA|nr:Gfo/Idh/MocA family oxidoreductase [Commensalibacter communis]CAI3960411.1 Predicted dehydrogenase (MviM) (PDB:3UUW) [Commensalibacter communis]CAI3960436.1 Predicted dehydrogenase (MviM) (PDB:3UUW) [Commensalibacter communis]